MMLAHIAKVSRAETVHPRINEENLAQMVSTTRPRTSHFMNKFRMLGFVDYNGGLAAHSGSLSVVLHD